MALRECRLTGEDRVVTALRKEYRKGTLNVYRGEGIKDEFWPRVSPELSLKVRQGTNKVKRGRGEHSWEVYAKAQRGEYWESQSSTIGTESWRRGWRAAWVSHAGLRYRDHVSQG